MSLNMKSKIVILSVLVVVLMSCGGGSHKHDANKEDATADAGSGTSSYDPQRGIGKFKDVSIPATIDENLVAVGNKVFTVKCSACHKTTAEKLVGPGWLGVTTRRKADWILNFATNPDPMIDKDPAVQAQLEICLVRMPNQNITDDEARGVYEFMRKNDAKK
jgi:mono/diheme cytochrome c family protein